MMVEEVHICLKKSFGMIELFPFQLIGSIKTNSPKFINLLLYPYDKNVYLLLFSFKGLMHEVMTEFFAQGINFGVELTPWSNLFPKKVFSSSNPSSFLK